MRNSINVTIPFVAPAGTNGTVMVWHNAQCGDKVRLVIDMGHQVNGTKAGALLTLDGVRHLVEGLLDAIDALERKSRLDTDNKEQ